MENVHAAVTPLRLIFWGAILCVLDFHFSYTTNGTGFRFDILNDAVGMAMIAYGVFVLADAPVSERYYLAMMLAKIMALVGIFEALRGHLIINYGELAWLVGMWSGVVGLGSLAAVIAFCLAMGWYCQQAGLEEARASWQITTLLFALIYAAPLGLIRTLAVASALLGRSLFSIDLGVWGLLLLPVFLAPLIHFFVSTSKMKRAAESCFDVV